MKAKLYAEVSYFFDLPDDQDPTDCEFIEITSNEALVRFPDGVIGTVEAEPNLHYGDAVVFWKFEKVELKDN